MCGREHLCEGGLIALRILRALLVVVLHDRLRIALHVGQDQGVFGEDEGDVVPGLGIIETSPNRLEVMVTAAQKTFSCRAYRWGPASDKRLPQSAIQI